LKFVCDYLVFYVSSLKIIVFVFGVLKLTTIPLKKMNTRYDSNLN